MLAVVNLRFLRIRKYILTPATVMKIPEKTHHVVIVRPEIIIIGGKTVRQVGKYAVPSNIA